jgi:hypothetical protein
MGKGNTAGNRIVAIGTLATLLGTGATPGATAQAQGPELSFQLKPVPASSATLSASSSVNVLSGLEVGQETSPIVASPTHANATNALVEQTQTPYPSVAPSSSHTPGAQVPESWWQMGSDSPLAVAIGAAEGTRTVEGSKNPAYYWHQDPGNYANNFGTFSYQHFGASETHKVDQQQTVGAKRATAAKHNLPELADQRQLKRLRQFHDQLRQQALAKGMTLTQLELVNGLDLVNQSEEAALAVWGYLDRLAQMKELMPHDPEEQILEARTWAYWSPDLNHWDAPGLGNTYSTIRHDQTRRYEAVKAALAIYQSRSSVNAKQIIESNVDKYHEHHEHHGEMTQETLTRQFLHRSTPVSSLPTSQQWLNHPDQVANSIILFDPRDTMG